MTLVEQPSRRSLGGLLTELITCRTNGSPRNMGTVPFTGQRPKDSSSQPSFFNSASCTQFGYRQFRGGIEFVSVGDLRRRILDDVRVDPLTSCLLYTSDAADE